MRSLLLPFSALVPTVPAKPLLGQLLLFQTLKMEPLPLAKGVVAHDHLPIGRLTAVTVLGLVRIILPLSFLAPILLILATFVSSLLQLLLSLVKSSDLQFLL